MPSQQETSTTGAGSVSSEAITSSPPTTPPSLLFTDLFVDCLLFDNITFDYDGMPPCLFAQGTVSSSQETIRSGSI